MWDLNGWLSWLSSLPIVGGLSAWLAELFRLSMWELLREVVDVFLRILGFAEFIKWIYRKFFGSKVDVLNRKIEVIEEELKIERKSVQTKEEELGKADAALKGKPRGFARLCNCYGKIGSDETKTTARPTESSTNG